MFDKLKDILPGTIVSLIISCVTTLVVFSSTFSTLRAEVGQNSEQIKTKIGKDEFNAIINSLNNINSTFDKRFDKLEDKIDRLNERK